jgi:hypothetical protein
MNENIFLLYGENHMNIEEEEDTGYKPWFINTSDHSG